MLKEKKVIVAVMQPYFFPYIGYWQLLNAVDKYVIYDDVNFINRGWINRNRIVINGQIKYINVPMLGASQNKLIKDIDVNLDKKELDKTVEKIKCAYRKAPYFQEVFPLIQYIMYCQKGKLSDFLVESIKVICDYLDITTELILSSDIEKNCLLRGEEKILAICEILGATDYYNAIGGRLLYNYEHFVERGIQLHFLQTNDIKYCQGDSNFINGLSIIDVMMYNSKETIKGMLTRFSLEEE